MACLAVHDKTVPDERYLPYLDIIKREAGDRRDARAQGRQLGEAECLAEWGGVRNRSGVAFAGRQEDMGGFGRHGRAHEREGSGQTQGTG